MSLESDRGRVVRVMVGNATLLSASYLGLGLFLEGLRHFFPTRWADRAAVALDALPMRALELVGAMPFLRGWYLWERISPFWMRVALCTATVGIVFLTAAAVGLFLWGLRRLL